MSVKQEWGPNMRLTLKRCMDWMGIAPQGKGSLYVALILETRKRVNQRKQLGSGRFARPPNSQVGCSMYFLHV